MTGSPQRWSRADLAIVPILIAALALRIVTANYALWFDEIAAVFFARQPPELLWSGWMVRETNPPLYYTLLGGWIRLFGGTDIALRLLSVAIGLCGIVAAWLLARRIAGPRAGLIAAALLALAAAHVDMSQEVRGYILAQAAALWACRAMLAWADRPRPALLFGYAAAALVALYTHTTMLVFVALANAALLWLLRGLPRRLVPWLVANAVVALLWAWWATITLAQAQSGSGIAWIERLDPGDALRVVAIAYSPLYLAAESAPVAPLVGALWLGGLALFAWRDRRPAIVALTILAVGAPLLLWAISQRVPVMLPRTLFWAAGPATILLAVAVDAARPRLRLALVALLLIVELGTLVRWLPAREPEGWPQAVAAMAQLDSDAAVLVQGDSMALAAQHYAGAQHRKLRLFVLEAHGDRGDPWGNGLARLPHLDAAGARALLAREGEMFTLRRGDHDPEPALALVGSPQPLESANGARQPHVVRWRSRQAALWSIPSSPSLR